MQLNIREGIFVAIVLVVLAFVMHYGGASKSQKQSMTCGHWCVVNSAALFGVPLMENDVQQTLPHEPNGHSLRQLADALSSIGIRTEGRFVSASEPLEPFTPCILHLNNPNHFVVLVSIRNSRWLLVDNEGKRQVLPKESLTPRLSGRILRLAGSTSSQEFRGSTNGPMARFRTLHCVVNTLESGAAHHFDFDVQNHGRQPLVVKDVVVDCSCLQITKPNKSIESGKSGVIQLDYRPTDAMGDSFHSAVVLTNDPTHPQIRLMLTGIGRLGLRVYPRSVDLGTVILGQTAKCSIFADVGNAQPDIKGVSTSIGQTEISWQILDPRRNAAAWLRPLRCSSCTKTKKMLIEISIKSTSNTTRDINGLVSIHYFEDGKEAEVPIEVRAQFVNSIHAIPSLIDFGEVLRDVTYRTRIAIVSRSNEELSLASIISKPPGVTVAVLSTDPTDGITLEFSANGAVLLDASNSQIDVLVRTTNGDETIIAIPLYAWEGLSRLN